MCYSIDAVIAFFPPTGPARARCVAALVALLFALPGCGNVRPGEADAPDSGDGVAEDSIPDGEAEDATAEEAPDAAEADGDDGGGDGGSDDGGGDVADTLPEGCEPDECECICEASGLSTGACCDSPWIGSIYYWYPIGPDGCPRCECGTHRERECVEGCVQYGPHGEPECVESL